MNIRPGKILFGSLIFLVFLSGVFSFFFFTTLGARLVVRGIVPAMLGVKKVSVGRVRGNLAGLVRCESFELDVSRWLPGGGTLRARTVDIDLAVFSKAGPDVKIKDVTLTAAVLGGGEARVNFADILLERNDLRRPVILLRQGWFKSADMDALLVTARLTANTCQANIYAKYISVPAVLRFFPQVKGMAGITGGIADLDLYVRGSLSAPEFSSVFKLPEIVYRNFSAVDCVGDFSLKLDPAKSPFGVNGRLNFQRGALKGPNGVKVELGESAVYFSGEALKPRLDARGSANIEGTKILIFLRGTADKPDLFLSSEPSMPQERLLVMLATGKKWSGAEDSLNRNTVTPDMALELIDYFALGGSGGGLARQLGLSDISFTFDQAKTGVSFKKDVVEGAKLQYSVEQTRSTGAQPPVTTQKVGGEIQLVPGVSISAQKELPSAFGEEPAAEKKKTDDTIMLKMKKEF